MFNVSLMFVPRNSCHSESLPLDPRSAESSDRPYSDWSCFGDCPTSMFLDEVLRIDCFDRWLSSSNWTCSHSTCSYRLFLNIQWTVWHGSLPDMSRHLPTIDHHPGHHDRDARREKETVHVACLIVNVPWRNCSLAREYSIHLDMVEVSLISYGMTWH
jgi:hypothetical protein